MKQENGGVAVVTSVGLADREEGRERRRETVRFMVKGSQSPPLCMCVWGTDQ